jgi:hypothetical protein
MPRSRKSPSPPLAAPTWNSSRKKFPPKSSPRSNSDAGETCSLLIRQNQIARFATRRCPRRTPAHHHSARGEATTIARVTCPTAPKFWRWRDIPFPKIAPREMEFHDDDHHADEWKWQIVARRRVRRVRLARAGFARAIQSRRVRRRLSRRRIFPAEEVWERLQKRVLDVHFLMLAVAVGAACIGAWAEGATLAVFIFLFRRAGTLRARPHAKRNSLPLSRRAENGDRDGCERK